MERGSYERKLRKGEVARELTKIGWMVNAR